MAHGGLELVPVPVDAGGIDVAAVAAAGVDAALVTPAHQSPTGVVLEPPRRAALAAWARETGALVIEDDYDAEYRYDRHPVGALQGVAPDHVVHVHSVSKTLRRGCGSAGRRCPRGSWPRWSRRSGCPISARLSSSSSPLPLSSSAASSTGICGARGRRTGAAATHC